MIDRRLFLAALPAALAGCAGAMKSGADGQSLDAKQGVLALRASANRTARVGFMPPAEMSFGSLFAENMFGAKGTLIFRENEDDFLVVPVDAGEYMWSKVEVGSMFAFLRESTRFRVAPGRVTYIGHLRLQVSGNRFSFRVLDKEQEMRDHLNANFPRYAQSLAFEKSLAQMRLSS